MQQTKKAAGLYSGRLNFYITMLIVAASVAAEEASQGVGDGFDQKADAAFPAVTICAANISVVATTVSGACSTYVSATSN